MELSLSYRKDLFMSQEGHVAKDWKIFGNIFLDGFPDNINWKPSCEIFCWLSYFKLVFISLISSLFGEG